MVAKSRILDSLGEKALLLPQSVTAALLANDRVKYYLTLLQAAALQATSPAEQPPDLTAERVASGEPDASLDGVPARSERRETGELYIPEISRIHHRILDAVAGAASLETQFESNGRSRQVEKPQVLSEMGCAAGERWSGREDSNLRPSEPMQPTDP